MKKPLKNMLKAFVGVALGTAAMKGTGAISNKGIRTITQVGVGLGTAGYTLGQLKSKKR